MSWVRVDDKFPRHPKVIALPAAAVALWLAGCCWASEYETDGRLPAEAVAHLSWFSPRSVQSLAAVGLWLPDGDGWIIHDFTRYNPSAAEKQAQREGAAERMKRSRYARVAPQHPIGCGPVAAPPSPSPSPLDQESTPDLKTPLPPKGARRVAPVVLPEWLPLSLWDAWRAHRRAVRAPLTPHAETLLLGKLGRWRIEGKDPVALIELAIERGWKGLFLPDERPANGAAPARPRGTANRPTWKDPAA